jgi:Icc-related predicted phosphoesterase
MQKIVVISDLHRAEKKVPAIKGDILICTGDLGILDEYDLNWILDWFTSLNFKYAVWIGGNHDRYLEELWRAKIEPVMPNNIHYLMNNQVTVNGIKFWGSPFSPMYNQWHFMDFLPGLKKIWTTIPQDTDIVLTHCPPFGINDQVNGISQGCPALRDKIKEIKPKYHIFGHIHEGYGIYCDENTTYINASLMDGYYDMTNDPIRIKYE